MKWIGRNQASKFDVECANKRDITALSVLENLKDTPLRMLNELFLRMFDLRFFLFVMRCFFRHFYYLFILG